MLLLGQRTSSPFRRSKRPNTLTAHAQCLYFGKCLISRFPSTDNLPARPPFVVCCATQHSPKPSQRTTREFAIVAILFVALPDSSICHLRFALVPCSAGYGPFCSLYPYLISLPCCGFAPGLRWWWFLVDVNPLIITGAHLLGWKSYNWKKTHRLILTTEGQKQRGRAYAICSHLGNG